MMRKHGGCPNARLDFSVNLNPLGPPDVIKRLIEDAIKERAYEAYPDYTYENFRKAIAGFYGIESDLIVPCNGAAEALSLIPLALRRFRVVTIEPMYGDWAYTSRILGVEWIPVLMREKGAKFEVETSSLKSALEANCENGKCILIVCNPNNPTGAYIDEAVLDDIIRVCNRLDCVVVIDEVYVEFCDKCKTALHADYPGRVIVVRSFTKTLSIPGLRVGFVYSKDESLIRVLDSARQPWNVNTIACRVIENALTKYAEDIRQFMAKSLHYVMKEREWLMKALSKLGIHVYESYANFVLCRLNHDVSEITRVLLDEYGMCIRPAHSFYGLGNRHFRISIRKHEENEVLVKALCEVLRRV